MGILNLARVPAVTIESSASVMQGIALMHREGVSTLFVIEDGEVVGAFTERDVAFRVVLRRRDPKATPIGNVMSVPARTLSTDASVSEAIQVMMEHRIRQLAIVNREGAVVGVVSLRHMLEQRAAGLTEHMDSLVAGLLADGIGG